MPDGLLIAAERSGSGKTMIVTALARALSERGRAVQCFKVGPDFIDPGYHGAAAGRISRNLDGWMMGRAACLRTFQGAMAGADFGLVEGVMGLFDGMARAGDDGSSAQIAKWLGLPVVLVIDGSSLSRSAGAVALGFEQFDPEVAIAGVVFNKVGSPAHYDMLKAGVQERCRAPVLGYVPRSDLWLAPQRHLGLVMAGEQEALRETVSLLARQLELTVDVNKILELAASEEGSGCRVQSSGIRIPESENRGAPPLRSALENAGSYQNPEPRTLNPKIAVARDEAFCFCYQENIELLERFGAEVVFFSPLRDRELPAGARGLYLPGGYPELHAEALSRNADMRRAVSSFCRAGRPAYAECGGFLYLLESLAGLDGRSHEMAGVFPSSGRMLPRLQRLGYAELEARAGHPFLSEGSLMRGHEFHYSETSGMPPEIQRTCRVLRRRDGAEFSEGYRVYNTLAGYVHVHFASQPGFAGNFVRRCTGVF